MDKIPYHKPMELSRLDKEDITNKIKECLTTGQLTNGKHVQELERQIKEMYDVDYCLAMSSCTQGLIACLEYGLPHGIQLPAFNWWSDLYILKMLKYELWWNDISKKTWLVKEDFRNRSLFVHTFGNVGISEKEEVIYDASHALGANLKDIGLASVFSLAPTKLITACEGGLVITHNEELAKFVREYRDKCARMSEIHAIIGLQTLRHLGEVKAWKKEVYEYYKKKLEPFGCKFQEIPYNSNYNTIAFLNTEGLVIPEHIETRKYYEPLHKGLKNTDYVYKNIIAIPSYFNCDYRKIVRCINEANY